MYWKLIKAREQEHIFNRQPANILRNLLAWEPASFIGSAEEGIADAWLDCIGLFKTEVSDEPSSPGVSIRDESDWRQRVRELLSMRGDAALSDNIKEKLKSVFSMVSLFIEGEKENIGDVVVSMNHFPRLHRRIASARRSRRRRWIQTKNSELLPMKRTTSRRRMTPNGCGRRTKRKRGPNAKLPRSYSHR